LRDMTAIAVIYRPSGFALAADGRCELGSGIVLSNSDQKTFANEGDAIAYAFSGFVFNQDRTWDLARECAKAKSVTGTYKNFQDYVEQFAGAVNSSLDTAKKDGHINNYPSVLGSPNPQLMSRLIIAGYFSERPSIGLVSFAHDSQKLLPPQIQIAIPPPTIGFCVAIGSTQIGQLIGQKDHWIETYARPVDGQGSLAESTSLAKGFIEACSDPRAQIVDPECHGIGGHIHVASITSTEGFKWVIPPCLLRS
jgi:hypothetical protein